LEEKPYLELKIFGIYVGTGDITAVLLGIVCHNLAKRKGRDILGWFLVGFLSCFLGVLVSGFFALLIQKPWAGPFPAFGAGLLIGLLAILILVLLPAIETHGFTKRCPGCQEIVLWKDTGCRACGRKLPVQEIDPRIKVKRPLRSCLLYVSLVLLLLAIVFGLIGYFCVPDKPRIHGSMEIINDS